MKAFTLNQNSLKFSHEEVYDLLTDPKALQVLNSKHLPTQDPIKGLGVTLSKAEKDWSNSDSERWVMGIVPKSSQAHYKILTNDPHIKLLFPNISNDYWLFFVKTDTQNRHPNHPEKGFNSYEEAHFALQRYIHTQYGLTVLPTSTTGSLPIGLHHTPDAHIQKYVLYFKQQPVRSNSSPTAKEQAFSIEQRMKNMDQRLGEALISHLSKPVPMLLRKTGSFQNDTYNTENVLYPNTINIIQGKTGTHKSRFAGVIGSALIHPGGCVDKLGLKLNPSFTGQIMVLYFDTERNINYQLPLAMKDIVRRVGYEANQWPANFIPQSLIDFAPTERLDVIRRKVNEVRNSFVGHLVVFIDVVPDAITNFNDVSQSMELVNFQNKLINESNLTFINVIHENPAPNSDKARGHLGTELANKSSIIFQLNNKGQVGSDTIFEMCYKKQRDDASYDSFFFKCDTDGSGLLPAQEAGKQLKDKQGKASVNETSELLGKFLLVPKTRDEVLNIVMSEFDCAERTAESTLKKLVDQKQLITNQDGEKCHLHKIGGKPVRYELQNEA